MIALYVILGIAALVLLWGIGIYNGLIKKVNLKNEAWSGIDVQLKRRFDLIPNLIETVKGYAGHEKEVFLKLHEGFGAVSRVAEISRELKMAFGRKVDLFSVNSANRDFTNKISGELIDA